jgi:hypothetical protein
VPAIFLEASMKHGNSKATTGRRNFLLALGAGGAATAVVAISVGKPAAVPAADAAAPQGKGYQLSQHVRAYYRTTKI